MYNTCVTSGAATRTQYRSENKECAWWMGQETWLRIWGIPFHTVGRRSVQKAQPRTSNPFLLLSRGTYLSALFLQRSREPTLPLRLKCSPTLLQGDGRQAKQVPIACSRQSQRRRLSLAESHAHRCVIHASVKVDRASHCPARKVKYAHICTSGSSCV